MPKPIAAIMKEDPSIKSIADALEVYGSEIADD